MITVNKSIPTIFNLDPRALDMVNNLNIYNEDISSHNSLEVSYLSILVLLSLIYNNTLLNQYI